jgi:hypothetical protein
MYAYEDGSIKIGLFIVEGCGVSVGALGCADLRGGLTRASTPASLTAAAPEEQNNNE